MSSGHVLPTKIYLMELKTKLSLMKFAKKILERKRDSLRESLKRAVEQLGDIIKFLKNELNDLLKYILSVAIVYEAALAAYSESTTEKLKVTVRFTPQGGVMIPHLQLSHKPSIQDSYPEGLRALIQKIIDNFDVILETAELLITLEALLRESEITSRIVNTLEKVAIPDLEEKIAYINMMLSEFMISELSSLRVVMSSMEE